MSQQIPHQTTDQSKLAEVDNTVAPVREFFGATTDHAIHANRTHIIGFGFDGTACFRKGTRNGPDGLRAVSEDIESYSPYLDADLLIIRFMT